MYPNIYSEGKEISFHYKLLTQHNKKYIKYKKSFISVFIDILFIFEFRKIFIYNLQFENNI